MSLQESAGALQRGGPVFHPSFASVSGLGPTGGPIGSDSGLNASEASRMITQYRLPWKRPPFQKPGSMKKGLWMRVLGKHSPPCSVGTRWGAGALWLRLPNCCICGFSYGQRLSSHPVPGAHPPANQKTSSLLFRESCFG
uniref:Uncharacterized protein n=1 Tax=Molossus molossus TaxID=27622 RepID=A0A7J8DQ68_MOLMO|nr:hypothetical protein HJG59_009217 [Molossus molossus]